MRYYISPGGIMTLQDRTAKNIAVQDNATLTIDDLLKSDETPLRAVSVPTPEWKWGSQVFVAEIDATERDELEVGWSEYKANKGSEENNVGFRAWCVAFCLCDQNRKLYAGNNDEVVTLSDRIAKKNAKTTARLFNVISRLNGLTKADIDALEGNSEATQPENADGSGELP
ncbi:MAG: hypothetical protein U0930_03585 [Pirellulales bacterium]